MNRRFVSLLARALAPVVVAGVAGPVNAQATGASAAAPVSLTLGQAARLAAQQGAAATGARFRADEFAARALESRASILPSLSGSFGDGQRTYNTASFGIPFPGFDPNGSLIGPVRTVDIRARVVANVLDLSARSRYHGAQTAAEGAGADANAAAEQAAALAASAYVRVLRADAQLAGRAADSALAADLLGIARAQLAAGVGVRIDVTRAESQVAGVHAQLIASRNERDRARLELARTVGIPLTTPVVLQDSLASSAESGASVDVEAALALARRSRPDLLAAAAAIRTARSSVSSARAERSPTIGVFLDHGFTSLGYSHLLNTYDYGVQLSVPIFDGNRVSSRIAVQTAVLHQAETRERDLEAQVEADVRAAAFDLASSRDQVVAIRERLRLAEEELALSRERFSAGVVGNAEVITAQLNITAARAQYVDALTAFNSARVALARATGRVTALP